MNLDVELSILKKNKNLYKVYKLLESESLKLVNIEKKARVKFSKIDDKIVQTSFLIEKYKKILQESTDKYKVINLKYRIIRKKLNKYRSEKRLVVQAAKNSCEDLQKARQEFNLALKENKQILKYIQYQKMDILKNQKELSSISLKHKKLDLDILYFARKSTCLSSLQESDDYAQVESMSHDMFRNFLSVLRSIERKNTRGKKKHPYLKRKIHEIFDQLKQKEAYLNELRSLLHHNTNELDKLNNYKNNLTSVVEIKNEKCNILLLEIKDIANKCALINKDIKYLKKKYGKISTDESLLLNLLDSTKDEVKCASKELDTIKVQIKNKVDDKINLDNNFAKNMQMRVLVFDNLKQSRVEFERLECELSTKKENIKQLKIDLGEKIHEFQSVQQLLINRSQALSELVTIQDKYTAKIREASLQISKLRSRHKLAKINFSEVSKKINHLKKLELEIQDVLGGAVIIEKEASH